MLWGGDVVFGDLWWIYYVLYIWGVGVKGCGNLLIDGVGLMRRGCLWDGLLVNWMLLVVCCAWQTFIYQRRIPW